MPEFDKYIGKGQRQPGYVRAGDRAQGYVSRGELPAGYRRASGRINARQTPATTKGFGGLNSYNALQDRGVKAFPTPGFEGQSASEIGDRLNKAGVNLDREGRFSPRDIFMRGDQGAMRRNGTPGSMGPAPAPVATGGTGGGALGAAARTAGSVMNAAAKAASNITGGPPAAQPQRAPLPTAAETAAKAQETRDARDMARDIRNDVSRTRDSQGRVTGISSKHGSGSVQFLDPKQQAARAPGMTKDDMGRVKPIREEINRMRDNQATKGIGHQGQPMGPAGPAAKDAVADKAAPPGKEQPGAKGATPQGKPASQMADNSAAMMDLYNALSQDTDIKKKGSKPGSRS